MRSWIRKCLCRLPFIAEVRRELEARGAELDTLRAEVEAYELELRRRVNDLREDLADSADYSPWLHPFLNEGNLGAFRRYSEEIWQFALEYRKTHSNPLKVACVANLNQNMYKWARLIQKFGWQATLSLNSMDTSALSRPEWEEFDGEYPEVADGENFLRSHPSLRPEVPCECIPMDGSDLYEAYQKFRRGERKPLTYLLARTPALRHEALVSYEAFYPYYPVAKSLHGFDVILTNGESAAAYASGRPYCSFSFGGDLQFDAGKGGDFGKASLLALNGATFLLVTNPHALGHCRRLGLTNALYLPYPMDDSRYSPGEGRARKEWESSFGQGIYVLMTSRIDKEYKGQDESFLRALIEAATRRPAMRFIFLTWGNHAQEIRDAIHSSGLEKQFVMLPPVGKKRLIDYYRSCDIVLDHFIFGYHGATGLEAAAVGKPVIMKLRREHYIPWYRGDYMPAQNASTPDEITEKLILLADQPDMRSKNGTDMREWLVRNHGEEKTVPLLLALLHVAADRLPVPPELENPLQSAETEAERDYHARCIQKGPPPEARCSTTQRGGIES